MRIKSKFNKDKLFFTSDTHFGHANAIKHSNRPFKDVEEMDLALMTLWNKTIPPDADVFHLGDLAWFNDVVKLNKLIDSLNGNIYLCQGNHDKTKSVRSIINLEEVADLFEIIVDDNGTDQKIVLCHYPMTVWNQSHRGSWHLYGHCHGTLPYNQTSLSCDVGVDSWGMRPVSYAQIKESMSSKTFIPIDRHGKE